MISCAKIEVALANSNLQEIKWRTGRRVALWSIAASSVLAAANVIVGLAGGSTSVVAAGFELVGDVVASTLVYVGMLIASRPPDDNHPYGHGRFEMLAGLVVGLILAAGGIGIGYRSLQNVGSMHVPPKAYAAWALVASIVIRSIASAAKFRVGRRLRSGALVADAWNDLVDILSAVAALVALGLTLYDPARFLAADHYGGFAVGLFVVFAGIRVLRDTSMDLLDTMPEKSFTERIREVALEVPGVLGVEKCYARKTGLHYHVDLHLEVDPNMTVWDSHGIAHKTQLLLKERLDWIADVLVHVEPHPGRAKQLGKSKQE
jgi:cation diffusion facilitator family transporter